MNDLKNMGFIHGLGLKGKSLLRLCDITDEQMLGLIEAARMLKERKRAGLSTASSVPAHRAGR